MMKVDRFSTFFMNDTLILFCSSGVNIKIPIHSAGVDNVTVLPASKGNVSQGISYTLPFKNVLCKIL